MSKLEVKISVVNEKLTPSYESAGAAGMDLKANLGGQMILGAGERCLVPTGVSIQLPEGYEAQVRPRSGLAAKNGVTVLNSPGTIDSDYTGEIKVILYNSSDVDFVISPLDRIAQMVVAKVERVSWMKLSELSETKRGSGGFGSTGMV